jgi:hypothetical protein
MKKFFLCLMILVVIFSLAGCESETLKPVELVSAKIIKMHNHKAVGFVGRGDDVEIAIIEIKKNGEATAILEFKPSTKLKTLINNLKREQKFHLEYEKVNDQTFGSWGHEPYYHVIKRITLLPSGEKHSF